MIGNLLPPEVKFAKAMVSSTLPRLRGVDRSPLSSVLVRSGQESVVGRWCASRALAELGRPVSVVRTGSMGEPLWPPGVVGSITHRLGYCAAAVASSAFALGVGIDVELNRPLSVGAARKVCTEEELANASDVQGTCAATLIFSIKESLYKAWYPVTHRWLSYADVVVSLSSTRQDFVASLSVPARTPTEELFACVTGRFALSPERVFTAVVVKERHGHAGRDPP